RRRHRSHAQTPGHLHPANRFPRRHRGEHDVANAEQIPAASLSSGAGYHLRLQQVPPYGEKHARKTPRLPRPRLAGNRLATLVRPRPRSPATQLAQLRKNVHHGKHGTHGKKTKTIKRGGWRGPLGRSRSIHSLCSFLSLNFSVCSVCSV